MKIILLVCALVGSTLAAEYTSKYDGVDVHRILNNKRILSSYIKCMLNEGSCTPEGHELKKTLPDALQTECSKCSEKQKSTAEMVIKHMMVNRPEDWERLLKKYDPEGEFKKRYEAQGKKL